jgi:hypothetical protein
VALLKEKKKRKKKHKKEREREDNVRRTGASLKRKWKGGLLSIRSVRQAKKGGSFLL